MSLVSNHPPASSAVTSSPACVSGRTATPPAAPRPMITTSVFFRSTAIGAALPEHRKVIGRTVIRCDLRVHLLFASAHGGANARIADQIPTDEVRVAAVIR